MLYTCINTTPLIYLNSKIANTELICISNSITFTEFHEFLDVGQIYSPQWEIPLNFLF